MKAMHVPGSTGDHARPRRAFTLVEVMVSMALLGIFFAGVATIVGVVVKRREEAQSITETSRLATAILDLMSADLWGAYLYNLELKDAFTGEHEGEYLHLVTTSDSRLPLEDLERDRARSASSITEVSYMIKEGELAKELYRREDYYIDGNLKAGGSYILLYDKLLSLRFTFLEATQSASSEAETEAEPVSLEDFQDKWQTDRATGLPRTVRIEIVLRVDVPTEEGNNPDELGYKFTRLIELPGYNPAELAQTEADPDLTPIAATGQTGTDGDQDGTGQDGTGQDGTGQDGTGQDGTGQDGTGDGTGQDGTGQDGTGDGTGQGGMGDGSGGGGTGGDGGGTGGTGGGGTGGTGGGGTPADRDGDGIPDDQDTDDGR